MQARLLAFAVPSRTSPRGRMRGVIGTGKASDAVEWPGDEKALTRFLNGDPTGFEQIVRHYSSMVFSLAARLLGPADAEDVVQETFLRAYRGLPDFRGESSLKTWLYTIALNRVRVRQGTLARMRGLFAGARKAEEDERLASALDEAADPAASPEEEAVQRDARRRLRQAIGRLPDDFRHAVVLRDLEGLPYDEIARILNVPIGTVRSRIARGRAALLEELS